MGTINIPDTAEFVIAKDDSIRFEAQTNGDSIQIRTHVDSKTAATLAYLANSRGKLISVEMKMIGEQDADA